MNGAALPIGIIITIFPGMESTLVDEWAIPYGQWLKEEEYPDLFHALGKQFGYNEEEKEFRLPKLVEFKDLKNLVRLTCGMPPEIKKPTYFIKIK